MGKISGERTRERKERLKRKERLRRKERLKRAERERDREREGGYKVNKSKERIGGKPLNLTEPTALSLSLSLGMTHILR